MNELDIIIQEVARIALEDANIRNYIGHELDLADEELDRVMAHLDKLYQDDMDFLKGQGK